MMLRAIFPETKIQLKNISVTNPQDGRFGCGYSINEHSISSVFTTGIGYVEDLGSMELIIPAKNFYFPQNAAQLDQNILGLSWVNVYCDVSIPTINIKIESLK